MDTVRVQRHANSTETIQRHPNAKPAYTPLETDLSDPEKLTSKEFTAKIQSTPQKSLKPYAGMTLNVESHSALAKPITVHTATNKSVKDMTPIEYYWAHKNGRVQANHHLSAQTPSANALPSPTSVTRKKLVI